MAFIILITNKAARWRPRQLRLPLPGIKMTQFEVKLIIAAHLPPPPPPVHFPASGGLCLTLSSLIAPISSLRHWCAYLIEHIQYFLHTVNVLIFVSFKKYWSWFLCYSVK